MISASPVSFKVLIHSYIGTVYRLFLSKLKQKLFYYLVGTYALVVKLLYMFEYGTMYIIRLENT